MQDLGLAFRLDAYIKEYVDGDAVTDLETPYALKLLASAPLSKTNATDPLLSVRAGEAGPLERYETITGGVGYLLRRNFRVSGEGTYDVEQDDLRWALGFVSAF